MILAGVIQGMISVLQVVPFILLARIAQMFLSGATRESFVTTGVWAVVIMTVTTLGVSALMIALHFYDAHFSAAPRGRLMDNLSRLPLGWFSGRGSGEVKRLVGDDVTALHYVIVHSVTDIVAAAVAPVTVLVYLFAVEWRLALVMLLPIAAPRTPAHLPRIAPVPDLFRWALVNPPDRRVPARPAATCG